MSFNNQYDETVSVGEWIGALIISAIPIVGLVMSLVWAFGSNAKPSKRNFFRAQLLLAVIVTGVCIVVFLLTGGLAAIIALVPGLQLQ